MGDLAFVVLREGDLGVYYLEKELDLGFREQLELRLPSSSLA